MNETSFRSKINGKLACQSGITAIQTTLQLCHFTLQVFNVPLTKLFMKFEDQRNLRTSND